jgi:hypothetical protein
MSIADVHEALKKEFAIDGKEKKGQNHQKEKEEGSPRNSTCNYEGGRYFQ